MMEPKLVFFDIDGTLKPYRSPVPEPTKAALRLLRENGHLPILCTGRTLRVAVANDWAEELNFAGIICAAGGHVVYQGETVYFDALTPEETVWLHDLLWGCGCTFVLEGPEGLYYEPAQAAAVQALWGNVFGPSVPLVPYVSGQRMPVQKAFIASGQLLEERGCVPALEQRFQVLWYGEAHQMAELVPKELSKATGIQALLTHLGMAREDTYAFGDGPNDVEMLRFCGCGSAWGTARLRRSPRRITSPAPATAAASMTPACTSASSGHDTTSFFQEKK
ncbi:MAG: HAD hydrolase family protein [Clostridiales bacterium]|nr:HAD hydrolase family protein [Clostridiales bacterium]